MQGTRQTVALNSSKVNTKPVAKQSIKKIIKVASLNDKGINEL